jgi:hypothetical protein
MRRFVTARIPGGIIAVVAVGVLCAACASKAVAPELTATPATASAVATTPGATASTQGAPEIVVLDPSTLTTTMTLHGFCWVGSNVSGRADAWRCSLDTALPDGANIVDPCYSTNADAESVVCPTNFPQGTDAVTVILNQRLGCGPNTGCGPGNAEGGKPAPVRIELPDGVACTFVEGATFGVNGERANFSCADTSWLVGDVTVGADGTWTYQRTPTGISGGPPQDLPLVSVRAVKVFEE